MAGKGNAVFGKNIRVKALVPVGSKSTSNIKRIYGVGVSAIIDIRILIRFLDRARSQTAPDQFFASAHGEHYSRSS